MRKILGGNSVAASYPEDLGKREIVLLHMSEKVVSVRSVWKVVIHVRSR